MGSPRALTAFSFVCCSEPKKAAAAASSDWSWERVAWPCKVERCSSAERAKFSYSWRASSEASAPKKALTTAGGTGCESVTTGASRGSTYLLECFGGARHSDEFGGGWVLASDFSVVDELVLHDGVVLLSSRQVSASGEGLGLRLESCFAVSFTKEVFTLDSWHESAIPRDMLLRNIILLFIFSGRGDRLRSMASVARDCVFVVRHEHSEYSN
jgi:hypothetical protein